MKKIFLCALSIALMSCSFLDLDEDDTKQKGEEKIEPFVVESTMVGYAAPYMLHTSESVYDFEKEDIIYLKNMKERLNDHRFTVKTHRGILEFKKPVTILDGLFYKCKSITEVALPTTLKEIGVNSLSYTAISSLIVPDSVTKIGDNAFAHCHELVKVSFPVGLKLLKSDAFKDTPKLDTLIFLGTEPLLCEYYAMRDAGYLIPNKDTTKVFVPKGCIDLYKRAFDSYNVFAYRELE